MQDDRFRSMIHGLETLGISRNQIAQNCGISPITVWRMAELTNWRVTREITRRVESLSREIKGLDRSVK